MKKTFGKFRFNLIEIALAMAIIAIGLSSILVLFPVGVNANKAAIADNNIADIAEYLIGYFRTGITNSLNQTPPVALSATLFANLPSSQDTGEGPEKEDDWNAASSTYPNLQVHSGKPNFFLYRQITETQSGEKIIDFAAEARLWKSNSIRGCDRNWSTNGAYTDYTINLSDNYTGRIYLEISWPAEAKYSERDKRVYVVEIFNSTHQLTY